MSRSDYIRQYREIALKQMKLSGIPASIILAQACLESSDGNSTLAVEAKNHFGIKCHDWKGRTYLQDDDKKNECFRVYDNVEQSFQDHSDFLRYRDRYAFLFELDSRDYKGWAYGLKKAGYATDPKYASSLIRIIEEYNLSSLDEEPSVPAPAVVERNSNVKVTPESVPSFSGIQINRQVYSRNGVMYILAESYDTYASLAEEFHLFHKEILRFNELKQDEPLSPGQMVYVERKKAQAADHLEMHVVEDGETMLSISQRFAIRLERLYRYNDMVSGDEPPSGELIYLCAVRKTAENLLK